MRGDPTGDDCFYDFKVINIKISLKQKQIYLMYWSNFINNDVKVYPH